jgi:hypothetical protein
MAMLGAFDREDAIGGKADVQTLRVALCDLSKSRATV